jgi:hypothetical protein
MLFHTVHPIINEEENCYENGMGRKKMKNIGRGYRQWKGKEQD